MTGSIAGRGVSRGVGPIAAAAIVGGALLAIAAAMAWLSHSPAPPERLEAMGCTELAAVMLDGGEAERRAALGVYVKKKCI